MTARLNKTEPESWSLDAPELAEDNPHALHEHGPRTRAVPGSNPGGPIVSRLSSVFPYAECRYVRLVGCDQILLCFGGLRRVSTRNGISNG